MGEPDAAAAKFAAAAKLTQRVDERFSEMLVIRDWCRELPWAVGSADARIVALGRAVNGMLCPALTYAPLLQWSGGGIDVEAAVAATEG